MATSKDTMLPVPSVDFESNALAQLPSLMAVAVRLTRNGAEAEDLVQDTFVKAMRARDQFEAGTNMRAWLLRIQTNTFINRYRRGTLERSVVDGADGEPLTDAWMGSASMNAMRDPESAALRPMLEAEIQSALNELPEEFRLAVMLSDIEELSYKEISDILGCPIGTVMSRLHRGRKMLKTRLYDHAVDLGIIDPNAAGSKPKPADEPVDINSYRAKRARSA
ncbi:MAG TPA: sigma-70 family RNA polymerase sigma factor [Polyangiaceae bacterium]